MGMVMQHGVAVCVTPLPSAEVVLRRGSGICSGYVPGVCPGRYMELYDLEGVVYAVVCHDGGQTVHRMGERW